MILVTERCQLVEFPKLEKCRKDPCNIYYLILHNTFTKEITLFKVRDYNSNRLRYRIYLKLPECFEEGEYTYFIVGHDDWEYDRRKISTNYPEDTQIQTDKGAIAYNGMYLVANGKMLVTSRFKAKVFINDEQAVWGDISHPIINTFTSKDKRSEGEIVKELNILNTGILKFIPNEPICCDTFEIYEGGETDYFIQYNG